MLRTALTLACLLLAALPGSGVSAAPLPDFNARYELRLGNLRIGTSTTRLETAADGSYHYESRSIPTKLVSWLFRGKLHETSTGTLGADGIRPDSYLFNRSGGRKEKREALRFDWQSMTVSNAVEGNRWEMDIPAGTLDELASQLAMMQALRDGETAVSITVADDAKLREYRFRAVGRETLELPAGRFDTVRITRLRDNRKRETYIWCAPALNYLPVRVWQREKDGSEYQSDLVEFSETLRVASESGPAGI
ncbi:MAG TPA: DUF3108 domain-containing protein [Gammaproteobacteria bacterium]|nr:DUF3108 domain-containing protein [Gammaproteobacteria bacterium]